MPQKNVRRLPVVPSSFRWAAQLLTYIIALFVKRPLIYSQRNRLIRTSNDETITIMTAQKIG